MKRVLVLVALLGCGGSNKAMAPANNGSSGRSGGGSQGSEDSGQSGPTWVTRGSAPFNNNGKRAFYGVGSANGIKNPALLRQTADNRARNELAKVFEVYTASLMKDYSNSDGEQTVESAVKTFTSMSLEGVQVVDRYIAGDGSMYALAELDIETVAAAVKRAKEKGIVKSHVTPVTVDDIFDKHGKKIAPKERPKVAQTDGGSSSTPAAPTEATSGAKTKTGAKPDWVDGEDARFAWSAFLCAVGYGPSRSHSENGAYAAVSKVFVAGVVSSSKDFMGAYSKTGAQSLEVQSSETLTQVSTAKLLSGVRIPEVWQDSASNTTFALACLERAQAAASLREQLTDLDGKVHASLEKASGLDAQGRLRELSRALDSLLLRESLNQELRIIDASGVGEPSPFAPYDVAAALEATQEALMVGVVADGPYSDDFRGALIDALTSRGYKIADGPDAAGLDVLVSAMIRMEDGGAGTGIAASMKFARGVIQVEVKNMSQGKIIGSFNESRKEGHRNLDEAERRVVRELAKKLSMKVGGKIDDTMKGR